jgi:mannitol-1-phosphate 5-dehydrogenase
VIRRKRIVEQADEKHHDTDDQGSLSYFIFKSMILRVCNHAIISINAAKTRNSTMTIEELGANKTVVMFGAGCVGRGFLGQLLSESGYALTFVEIDELLIEALNARRAYTLRLVENDWSEDLVIPAARTLYSRADETLVTALAETSLVTTAVGVRSLPDIAPIIATGIVRRAECNVAAPLNVLICENMQDASTTFRGMVMAHVPTSLHAYADAYVGFVDVVIGRTIPKPTPEMRATDCSFIIADAYKKLPVNRRRFIGSLPEIVGLIPTDNFTAYIERKLYLHNCGHAILSYLGYRRGHQFSYQALADPAIHAVLERAFAEVRAGFLAVYGMDAAELDDYIAELFKNFANRALADTVVRLARDPLRKLGPKERLVGAARLVEKAGVMPEALSVVIAAAYRYDDASDPLAVELQRRIAAEGIEAVMADVSDIQADEPLGKLALEKYLTTGIATVLTPAVSDSKA